MITFLRTSIINRTKTLEMFYEDLLKRDDLKDVVTVNLTNADLIQVKKAISDADILLIDTSFILTLGEGIHISRNLYLDRSKTKSFYLDVWREIECSDKPLFLLFPATDLHAVNFGLSRDLYLSILKRAVGIFWPYNECPFKEGEDDRYELKLLSQYGLTKEKIIDLWKEVRLNIPINIDFARCLSENEILTKSKKKYWDFIVAGVGYQTREIAIASAKTEDLKVAPYLSRLRWEVTYPYLVYNKILPQKTSTKLYQSHSFNAYKAMIARSESAFACGSELRYFVRKFLEIPAFRTAMIAYPSYNFREYGFVDGEHYLETYPEEAGKKAVYLKANKHVADKLVNNAWQLVKTEHVSPVRVTQVLNCLEAFLRGKLKSAGYQNGRFEIL